MEIRVLKKQVDTVCAQLKSAEQDKVAAEAKMFQIEKAHSKHFSETKTRMAELKTSEKEALQRVVELEAALKRYWGIGKGKVKGGQVLNMRVTCGGPPASS